MDLGTLQRLQARDLDVQLQTRREFSPRVMRLCRQVLGGQSRAEEMAHDILSDFLSVHVDRIQHPRAVGSYLRIMTVRRCRRIREKQRRWEAMEYEPEAPQTSETSPFMAAEQTQLRGKMAAGLRTLPPEERDLLRMRFLEEMTFETMAQKVGTSRQYVGRRVEKALARLRATMGPVDAQG